jgi:hypothetical protein
MPRYAKEGQFVQENTGISVQKPISTGPVKATEISWKIVADYNIKWRCRLCGFIVPNGFYDSNALTNHLWKAHEIHSVQIGYNWAGIPK